MWCKRAVSFISLCSRAAVRTPASPWDTRSLLWVKSVLGWWVFSSICGLPSSLSADSCPSLFERFIGTTSFSYAAM